MSKELSSSHVLRSESGWNQFEAFLIGMSLRFLPQAVTSLWLGPGVYLRLKLSAASDRAVHSLFRKCGFQSPRAMVFLFLLWWFLLRCALLCPAPPWHYTLENPRAGSRASSCLSESTAQVISSGLMVIAPASELVFLLPHLSPYGDTAVKASPLKYESDRVVLWHKPLQRLFSTSKGKAKVIRVSQKALCQEHLQLLGLQHFTISLWSDQLLLFPLSSLSNHRRQSRFCLRAFALADFPGDADVTLSSGASLSKMHIMHSPSTS